MILRLLLLFGLAYASTCFAGENDTVPSTSAKQEPTFVQVYAILETNCAACHIENGTATAAWTLDKLPTTDSYAECMNADAPALCTTYVVLTETEYPWVVAGKPEASIPYINACVEEESYHIGVSIPKRLRDEDCHIIRDWILNGAIFQ